MKFNDKIEFMGKDSSENEAARRLYHEHASIMPICDYHSHLDPGEIANNTQFDNLTQLWLKGITINGVQCAAQASLNSV